MTELFCCITCVDDQQSRLAPDPCPIILPAYGGGSYEMPRIAFGTGKYSEHREPSVLAMVIDEAPNEKEVKDIVTTDETPMDERRVSHLITHESVLNALRLGVQHLDCAEMYGNENIVGDALQQFLREEDEKIPSKVTRRDIFLTSKCHSSGSVQLSIQKSLTNLKTEYLDLYLLHSPFIGEIGFAEVQEGSDAEASFLAKWAEMEDMMVAGAVRNIGVTNFRVADLKRLRDSTGIQFQPVVNQVEGHPLLPQPALRDYCSSNEIKLLYYSPLVPLKRMDQCRRVSTTMQLLASERKWQDHDQSESEEDQYQAADAMVRASVSLRDHLERVGYRTGFSIAVIFLAWGVRVADGIITSSSSAQDIYDSARESLSVYRAAAALTDEDVTIINQICDSWRFRQHWVSDYGTNWSG